MPIVSKTERSSRNRDPEIPLFGLYQFEAVSALSLTDPLAIGTRTVAILASRTVQPGVLINR